MLQNANVTIRKMANTLNDYALLSNWLTNPDVLKFYGGQGNPLNLDQVIDKYHPRIIGRESVTPCILLYNRQEIGYLQYYRVNPKEYGIAEKMNMNTHFSTYGIDLFIGEPTLWGMGIGSECIQLITRFIFEKINSDAIFIDPYSWNKRAINCYKKCGFKEVALLKEKELYEGKYQDRLILCITRNEYINQFGQLGIVNF